MEREALAKWWDDAWEGGLWAAPWGQSVQDLTPEQAAWKPAAGRHSIWQIVTHIIFWRELDLGLLAGRPKPGKDEINARQFAEPAEVTAAAWRSTIDRLADTQRQLSAAIRDPAHSLARVQYLLPHDCYHFGQINYLRAMQGLKPIE
jgi:hypothetical protein